MRKKRPRLEKGTSPAVAIVIVIAIVVAGLGSYVMISSSGGGKESGDVLVQGANEFAFDIYSKLAEEDKNTFLSPFSIYTCLAMVYEGARGETAREIGEVLNLPEENSVRRAALAELQRQLSADRGVKLKTANALWPQENYPFLEEYLETVRKYYLVRIEALDYLNDASGAVERINNWAAEHTENKIRGVLDRLSPLTRLVLTNAIYFKGNWLIPFDESRTEDGIFHLLDGSTAETPMMQFHENVIAENRFYYAETDNIKALKLLYSGEDMSMIFLLPKEGSGGIGWLQNFINSSVFEDIQEKFEMREMSEIKIPKFEFEVKYEGEFKDALQDLGINAAFAPEEADFSGMDGTRDLYVSKTAHKAYIKVDEEGTEAAAVTAVVMELTATPPKPSFVADRPFMFVIRDEMTGAILFMGNVSDPRHAVQTGGWDSY